MRKGVRLLSWGDIYCDLMSRLSIHPDWGSGGMWDRDIETWNILAAWRIFCEWIRHWWPLGPGRIHPILGDPATSVPRVETGPPGPSTSPALPAVLGHFRFLQATLKSFGSAGRGWRVTSWPHGATKIGGKGMMGFTKPLIIEIFVFSFSLYIHILLSKVYIVNAQFLLPSY